MRRYLGERERAEHDAIGVRGKRGHLLGRIAIKDAVRLHRWRSVPGHAIWPVEIAVSHEPNGRPTVGEWPRVSVAHKDDVAVALVDDHADCGIDIERIEPRTAAFLAIAFTPGELALGAGREADEWYARLWAAKEAVGKARGTGITDPKQLEVRAAAGERLTIDDFTIDTRREGDYVIAWTRRLAS
jgi:phosphopantetheinyl transferase